MDNFKLKARAFDVMMSKLLVNGVEKNIGSIETATQAAADFAKTVVETTGTEREELESKIQYHWNGIPKEHKFSKGRSEMTSGLEDRKFYWVKLENVGWTIMQFNEYDDYSGVEGGFFSIPGTDAVFNTYEDPDREVIVDIDKTPIKVRVEEDE